MRLFLLFLALLSGCSIAPPKPPISTAPTKVSWADLPGWNEEDPAQALEVLLKSCVALKKQPAWSEICRDAAQPMDQKTSRQFFEQRLVPYQLLNQEGKTEGLITGYYEPLLHGSRFQSSRYRYPVYGVPKNLLTVELGELYPELKHLRLRGRLEGNKVVPFYSRSTISADPSPLKGDEILWVDNALDLFFLQIQGSGRIELPDGQMLRLGYADQNGYPYQSIGKVLVARGELTLEQATMDGIRQWAADHPQQLDELLRQNPSYVFFRVVPGNVAGPVGALGVPLTGGRSLAVDPRSIPLGTPVFLSTTWPESDKPLNRLMFAQDTGGAIKGAVRADFFWGFGAEAGELAGKMKQRGKLWMLLPQ